MFFLYSKKNIDIIFSIFQVMKFMANPSAGDFEKKIGGTIFGTIFGIIFGTIWQKIFWTIFAMFFPYSKKILI